MPSRPPSLASALSPVLALASVSRMLRPRTIAVIGGQECERVMEQCDKLGFDGTIWPVHPKRETMAGRPCFKTVGDCPGVPDAAFVAVNREATIAVIKDLADRGCGGAVCYAAGFSEATDDAANAIGLEQRLVEAAGSMPIIGPNCYGFINAVDRVALWPDQHGAVPCDGGVAIIAQSSNIAINVTMQHRALPIAILLTVGNQAQTGLSDLASAALDDERVTALGLYVEGLDDVHTFEAVARKARQLKKPIVVLKVGRSDLAQKAALTHTASLSGSQVAHSALFRRLGVAEVASIDALVEALKLLHTAGPLPGRAVLSLSCSGGEASLMADAGERHGLAFPAYAQSDENALTQILGDIVTISNPLDYNTFIWGDWPGMIRMFETALAPPSGHTVDLALLVMDFPRGDWCDPHDWDRATKSFVAAVKQTGGRAAVIASLPEALPEDTARWLMSVGITPLCGFDAALEAVAAAATLGEAWAKPEPKPLLPFQTAVGNPVPIDEWRSKRELAACGLVVPKGGVVRLAPKQAFDVLTVVPSEEPFSPDKTYDTLASTGPLGLPGPHSPFALKALGVAHKSE
ncbi:MAG: CoA-binding protein, partial [Pseudomonadota bacterium]